MKWLKAVASGDKAGAVIYTAFIGLSAVTVIFLEHGFLFLWTLFFRSYLPYLKSFILVELKLGT